MESEPLTSSPGDEADSDAQLRQALSLPPLRDDGFTHRVVRSLPRAPGAPRRRLFVILGGAAGGLGVGVGLRFAAPPPSLPPIPAAAWSDPSLPLALLVLAATLLYVFKLHLQRRPLL